jgi:peroxin-11C
VLLDKLADFVNDLSNQLYYPVEHVAWAVDNNLLAGNSTPLWTTAVVLWAVPLLIALIRTITRLAGVRAQLRTSIDTTRTKKLLNQRFSLSMDLVQSLCDLALAVFWMPPGFLWAGKLPALWWGLLGTTSSLIGLYKITNVCT